MPNRLTNHEGCHDAGWRREHARAGDALTRSQGSVPREAGAWMAVFADDVVGTIGGGHLEFQAIDEARRRLAGASGRAGAALSARAQPGPVLRRRGAPALRARRRGRCRRPWPAACRRAARRWRCSAAATSARRWCNVLAPLPFAVTWIDSRDEIFPPQRAGQRRVRALRSGAGRGGRPGAGLARADHELQPRRGPGRRGRLPAAPARARRPALHRPDRQQDQVGDLPPPAGGARLHASRNWRRSPARSACPASPARSRR